MACSGRFALFHALRNLNNKGSYAMCLGAL